MRGEKKKKFPIRGIYGSKILQLSFLIQTVLSVQEINLLNAFALADFTAGMEFHHSPKICTHFFRCDSIYLLKSERAKLSPIINKV